MNSSDAAWGNTMFRVASPPAAKQNNNNLFGNLGQVPDAEENASAAVRNLPEPEAAVPNYQLNLNENIRCKEEFEGLEVPDERIYFYLGHGGSMTTPDHNLKIERVPPNCIFITQTVCGIVNTSVEKIFKAFADKKNAAMWRDPVNHLNEFNALFGDLPGIHIHYPNCTFVDTSFQPCSDNGDRGVHHIEYSGMVPLSKAHTISFKKEPQGFDLYTQLNIDKMIEEGKIPGVSEQTVREMYRYSDYPTLKITPGKKQLYIPPKTGTMAVYSESGIVPFESLIQGSSSLSNSNSMLDLMNQYPGIHFNFLCRSLKVGLNPERRRQLTLRRRHSAVVQKSVMNSIAKIANIGFNFGTKYGEMTNDKDVLEFIQTVEDEIRAEDNMKKFYGAMHKLRNLGFAQSYNYMLLVFTHKYLTQFYTLLQNNASIDEIKAHINILQQDIKYINQPMYELERYLLDQMATMAFSMGNRVVTRHLCRRGAPLSGMQAYFNSVKNALPPQTRRQGKLIFKDCQRAFGKAKTRRNRENNSNHSSGNSNNNRSTN